MPCSGLEPIRRELIGLSRKSPTTAPSGRVRINADQKSVVRDIFVQK